jgi:hypothetical protein
LIRKVVSQNKNKKIHFDYILRVTIWDYEVIVEEQFGNPTCYTTGNYTRTYLLFGRMKAYIDPSLLNLSAILNLFCQQNKNVISPCTSVISTRTSVISTRTSVITTRKSWISTRKVWCPHAECDVHTQSVIFTTQSAMSTSTSVILTCKREIMTLTSVIQICTSLI